MPTRRDPKDVREPADPPVLDDDALPRQDDLLDPETPTDITTGGEGGGPRVGYGTGVDGEDGERKK